MWRWSWEGGTEFTEEEEILGRKELIHPLSITWSKYYECKSTDYIIIADCPKLEEKDTKETKEKKKESKSEKGKGLVGTWWRK